MTRVLPVPAPASTRERTFGGEDGFALLWIQIVEQIHEKGPR